MVLLLRHRCVEFYPGGSRVQGRGYHVLPTEVGGFLWRQSATCWLLLMVEALVDVRLRLLDLGQVLVARVYLRSN